MRFFTSKRKNVICNDCKRIRIFKELRNSPKLVTRRKDIEWAKLVKEQAGHKCEYCGKTETLNSHHIFSRSNRSVRWDVDNGVCLCVAHHTFSSAFSAHKSPIEFIIWLQEKRGQEWYDNLRIKARSIYKP